MIELYAKLYPIRYLLGALGGALLVVALTWANIPFKSRILCAVAGVMLIVTTFLLKHEYLKRLNMDGQSVPAKAILKGSRF